MNEKGKSTLEKFNLKVKNYSSNIKRMFKKYDKILVKYNIDLCIIESKWNEPNRFYHNIDHLLSILKQIENKYDPNDYIYEFYILAAFFHDIVYVPGRNDNEEKSVKFMFDMIGETPVTKKVEDIILETKNISPSNYFDFWKFDNSILLDSDFDKLLDYETKIRKEFSVYNDEEYKKGRIEFLNNFLMNNTIDSKQANLINNLKSYINSVYR